MIWKDGRDLCVRIWKEAFAVCMKVLFQHLSLGTEEDHEHYIQYYSRV